MLFSGQHVTKSNAQYHQPVLILAILCWLSALPGKVELFKYHMWMSAGLRMTPQYNKTVKLLVKVYTGTVCLLLDLVKSWILSCSWIKKLFGIAIQSRCNFFLNIKLTSWELKMPKVAICTVCIFKVPSCIQLSMYVLNTDAYNNLATCSYI